MSVWHWVRATGERLDLPSTLDVVLSDTTQGVSVVSPESRHGAYVDAYRVKLEARKAELFGRLTYSTLDEAREEIARLGWYFGGGVGRFYPRDTRAQYIRAVLESWAPKPGPGGLLWEIEASFLIPDPFWLDETLTTHQVSIAAASGGEFMVAAGGGWDVWPAIEMTAVGASVTNPRVDNLTRSRYVLYSDTLTAGQTLKLDPDALTATVGDTGVVNAVNIEWFNPLDRFGLSVLPQRLKLSASSIGAGGSLVAKLSWRRRWL